MADSGSWEALGAGIIIGIVLVAAAYPLGVQGPSGIPGGATAASPTSPATTPSGRVVVLEAEGGLPRFKSWSSVETLVKTHSTSFVGGIAYQIASQTPTVTVAAAGAATATVAEAGTTAASPTTSAPTSRYPALTSRIWWRLMGRGIFAASHGIVKVYEAYPPSPALEDSVDVCGHIYRRAEIFNVALVAPVGAW